MVTIKSLLFGIIATGTGIGALYSFIVLGILFPKFIILVYLGVLVYWFSRFYIQYIDADVAAKKAKLDYDNFRKKKL